jgi:hypothetical protein
LTLRPLRPTDALSDHGYLYPAPDQVIASAVVADAEDAPLMAAVVSLQPQAYLYIGDSEPAVKLVALRMLHVELARQLRVLGYMEADCEIPPEIKMDRMLKRMGWIRNTWEKWFVRF